MRGTWKRRSSLPVAVSEVGVGVVDDVIHVVGGTEKGGEGPTAAASTLHLAYDPRSDRWDRRAPLPIAMSHVGVVGLDGRLYAFGGLGRNVHLEPKNAALAYLPEADRWEALPPFSSPRGGVTAAAVNGKIHIFGGRNSSKVIRISPPDAPEVLAGVGTVNTHEVFDPRTASWSEALPLPGPPRDHAGIAVLNGKIHVFGGRINDYSDMLDRHDVYDPVTGSWSSGAALPRPRSAGAFAVLDDLIIYAGGECKPGGKPFTANAFEDVTGYDAKTDQWLTLTSLPEGRHAFGAGTVGGVAYFAGGALLCGGGSSTDLLTLTL